MNLMNVQVLAKFPLLQALDSTQYKLLLHLPLHHQTTSGGKNLGRESGWALICMITQLVLGGHWRSGGHHDRRKLLRH